jgi:hypothetical protein
MLGLAIAATMAAVATTSAQGGSGRHDGPRVSRDVRQILREISDDRIESSIRTLADFVAREIGLGVHLPHERRVDAQRGGLDSRAAGAPAADAGLQ